MLTVFHRGGRSALAWWDKSPGCPSCQGMPEEKKIVQALAAVPDTYFGSESREPKMYESRFRGL